jgi:hypothetical protein
MSSSWNLSSSAAAPPTSAAIRMYRPTTSAADVLKPISLDRTFRSVGMSYVLHCLPGDIESKAVAFDNLAPLLEAGGVIFGTTILGHGVEHTPLGRTLIRAYNRKEIFSNLDDGRHALERALAARFDRYELEVSGSVALFAGWTA